MEGKNDSINFYQPLDTWRDYGILEYPIEFNEKQSGYKAITRKNTLIAIVSNRYKVLPNEEAVEIADQAAESAGLVPFTVDHFGEAKDWYQPLSDHVILDQGETRVHALYAINKSFTVGGEKMFLGVGVHNSIDGTMGFGCGVFSFRHACANMVFAGMRGYMQSFDERKTLAYIYRRHVGEIFESDKIQAELKISIEAVMNKAQNILEAYRLMERQEVTLEIIKKLWKQPLPAKIYPEWIPSEKGQAQLDAKGKNVWDLYNAFTANIWHNESSSIRTKMHNFTSLHKVLTIEVRQ